MADHAHYPMALEGVECFHVCGLPDKQRASSCAACGVHGVHLERRKVAAYLRLFGEHNDPQVYNLTHLLASNIEAEMHHVG